MATMAAVSDDKKTFVSLAPSTLGRVDDSAAVARYVDSAATDPTRSGNFISRAFYWYIAWAMPALGMFSEAYIVFSLGQTKPFQAAMYPECFKKYLTCDHDVVRTQNYIQICGIMAGMLLFGFIGDLTGRKWGSRIVACVMMTGCILLIGTPFMTGAGGLNYLNYFIVAQTWYGFGVGGEYPMASASASERAASMPHLQMYRGRQTILVFSGQGQGNFVNSVVILICMAIFGQTAKALTYDGSQNVIALMYGVGAFFCAFMVWYRFNFLHESKVWREELKDYNELTIATDKNRKWKVSMYYYWPRLWVTCIAWIANDFAFYGNKLFQNVFISLLYPTATPFIKQQWTVLNSFVALTGYYWAAWLVDKPWYGRRRCQSIGFLVIFVLFLLCAILYVVMTDPANAPDGLHWFQFLYYFSSFWNQFGPNATTWLVAAEVYPTDIRASFQGISACMGKMGAIVADVAFGYVNQQTTFYLSAGFCLFGFVVTHIWLPDTTGLQLDEIDRMHKYALAGELHHYHGEAVNPRHLSPWEIYVLKWHKNYDPEADRRHKEVQAQELAKQHA